MIRLAPTTAQNSCVYLALRQGSATKLCNPLPWRRVEEGYPALASSPSFCLLLSARNGHCRLALGEQKTPCRTDGSLSTVSPDLSSLLFSSLAVCIRQHSCATCGWHKGQILLSVSKPPAQPPFIAFTASLLLYIVWVAICIFPALQAQISESFIPILLIY